MKTNKSDSNEEVVTDDPTPAQTAIAVRQPGILVSQQQLERIQGMGLGTPQTMEELALFGQLMQAEDALEAVSIPILNSRDLIGIMVDVLDASFKPIVDDTTGLEKICVNFVLRRQDTGERVQCLKSSNSFNNTYVDFFNLWRPIAPRELKNYQFVKDEKWKKKDNAAIVLRQVQALAA